MNRTGQPVDWGDEIVRALRILGAVLLRLLSYLMNVVLTVLLIGAIAGTIVGVAFLYYVQNYVDGSVDQIIRLSSSSKQSSAIYTMDWDDMEAGIGTPVMLEEQQLYGEENRVRVAYSEIPKDLINAIVATEDHRFWDHGGVDWIRTIRATASYFLGGGESGFGGASTITQQTIKNVTGDNQVTIQRKAQEIIRALNLEKDLSKKQILEIYLNAIYLSRGCYGVQAAAYKYFKKDVSELSLLECAALAGITQSPSAYDPISHPEANKERRQTVLRRMYKYGYISEQQLNDNLNASLELNVSGETASEVSVIFSWYTDAAIEEAISLLMEQLNMTYKSAETYLFTGGLKIVTVQDPEIQSTMEEYFANESNFAHVDDSAIQPECSMVIIDPKTGYVLGLVGGRGDKTANRLLNYATATYRSPGSSIKPLSVYGPAMDLGIINYASVYDDTPANFGVKVYDEKTGAFVGWSRPQGYPSNYSNTYRGLTPMSYAIAHSLNTVAYKVLDDLTVEVSFDYLTNKLHFSQLIEEEIAKNGKVLSDKDYAPLALGGMTYGCSVIEMTAAYQIFVNDGVYTTPTLVYEILDPDDKVIAKKESSSEVVISSQTASIMTKLLQNVVSYGTASAAITVDDIVECAGKTGTTASDNDRWFLGYTPYYVGGVWFGYSQPASLSGFSAAVSPATKTWNDIMTLLHQKLYREEGRLKNFTVADGVFQAAYCVDSGKLLTDACKSDPRGSRIEYGYFTYDTVPKEACDCHILVNYDISTDGGVAIDGACPNSSTRKYGMIRVTGREFPVQIYVADAEYVYREMPENVPLCDDPTLPYFYYALPEGTYCGLTSKLGYASNKQFNRSCQKHLPKEEPEEEPEEETGEDKEAAKDKKE